MICVSEFTRSFSSLVTMNKYALKREPCLWGNIKLTQQYDYLICFVSCPIFTQFSNTPLNSIIMVFYFPTLFSICLLSLDGKHHKVAPVGPFVCSFGLCFGPKYLRVHPPHTCHRTRCSHKTTAGLVVHQKQVCWIFLTLFIVDAETRRINKRIF